MYTQVCPLLVQVRRSLNSISGYTFNHTRVFLASFLKPFHILRDLKQIHIPCKMTKNWYYMPFFLGPQLSLQTIQVSSFTSNQLSKSRIWYMPTGQFQWLQTLVATPGFSWVSLLSISPSWWTNSSLSLWEATSHGCHMTVIRPCLISNQRNTRLNHALQ